MVEELERAQIGVKLEGCWCGAFVYAEDVVLVTDSRAELQAMLDVVETYVPRWKMKLKKGGLSHLPPKFEHIFVAVITFFPFLLCI